LIGRRERIKAAAREPPDVESATRFATTLFLAGVGRR